MSRLPSTTGLLAFVEAARSLSFLQASSALHLTPGAVSRQIQGLEALLGARLFVRHHKRVELTGTGRDYLAEIEAPLEQIARATRRIRGDAPGAGAVSILAYPTFAIRWLIPRWARFYDRHPEIEVRLTTSLHPVNFATDDYDLAVQVLPRGEHPPGVRVHPLVDVELFPVCSPELARRLGSVDELRVATLIHGTPRPRDWSRWLPAAGVSGVDAERGLRFESLSLAMQAAIEGLGVAIAIGALVEEDLAAGRLVRPFALARQSGRPFVLACPETRASDPKVAAFRDWLLEEAAAGGEPAAITSARSARRAARTAHPAYTVTGNPSQSSGGGA